MRRTTLTIAVVLATAVFAVPGTASAGDEGASRNGVTRWIEHSLDAGASAERGHAERGAALRNGHRRDV